MHAVFYVYRFDFLKVVGGKLLKPNVDPRSEWTGDKVRQISGHGDVYSRPTFFIKLEPKVHALLFL